MSLFSKKLAKNIIDWERDLVKFCVESNIEYLKCNFHIVNVNTKFKTDDYEVSKKYFKDLYNTESNIIYQIFDVEITLCDFDFSKCRIEFNDNFLEATLIFDPGFLLDSNEEYVTQLKNYIISNLISKGIIITNIEILRATIKKIIHNFELPFMLLEESRHTILKSKVSYMDKGFHNMLERKWCLSNKKCEPMGSMYAVNTEDLIAVFLKEASFHGGRDLRGEYIENATNLIPAKIAKKDDKKDEFSIPPEAQNGVQKNEEGNIIKYEATTNGFVDFKNGKIKLTEIATFEQIDRHTGCLLGGVEKMSEVDVECYDNSKDAIQSGLTIEAEILNITGNIGENTIIRAKRLSIKGQTHQTSKIYAEEAFINIHKGYLEAKEVNIEFLEAGRVIASDANILECRGGKIVSNSIVISKLYSHSTIEFSESLHLKLVDGGDNQIIMDMNSNMKYKPKLLAYIEKDNNLRNITKSRNAYFKDLVQKLNKIKPVIQNLKPIIDKSKKNGTPLDPEVKKIAGVYAGILKQIKSYKDILEQIQKERVENVKNINEIEKLINEAKITTEASWRDNNEIILIRNFPKDRKNITMQDSDMYDIMVKDYEPIAIEQE